MIEPNKLTILAQCKTAAAQAGHPFPGAAAAEAALETSTAKLGWFSSRGFQHNNLLGIKATSLWAGGTVWLHGWEVVKAGSRAPSGMRSPVRSGYDATHDEWAGDMEWAAFPSFAACYQTQMRILRESKYAPEYAPALAAKTAEEYIGLESAVWATGPQRGATVLSIFKAHQDLLGQTS